MLRILFVIGLTLSFFAAASGTDEYSEAVDHAVAASVLQHGGEGGSPAGVPAAAHKCHQLSCTQSMLLPGRQMLVPAALRHSKQVFRLQEDPHAIAFERDPPVPREFL